MILFDEKVHLMYLYKLSADRKCLKAGQSILCLLSRHGYRYGIMDTTCSMNEYWMPFKVRSFPNRVVHDLLLSNSSCSSTKKDIFFVLSWQGNICAWFVAGLFVKPKKNSASIWSNLKFSIQSSCFLHFTIICFTFSHKKKTVTIISGCTIHQRMYGIFT